VLDELHRLYLASFRTARQICDRSDLFRAEVFDRLVAAMPGKEARVARLGWRDAADGLPQRSKVHLSRVLGDARRVSAGAARKTM
jgi:hypothetical protein